MSQDCCACPFSGCGMRCGGKPAGALLAAHLVERHDFDARAVES